MSKELGGSKTILRVGVIMSVFEEAGAEGLSSVEVAAATGMDKATTYRALKSLEQIGFLDREISAKKYHLGGYLFSLGARVASHFSILKRAREAVANLAEQTGDTVYLTVRNRFDGVCIDRLSGAFPIKAQTLSIGDRVPLGLSCGGLAILSGLADDEVRRAIQYNAVDLAQLKGIKNEDIYRYVEDSRQRGYAQYHGAIIAGLHVVGHALIDSRGDPFAAISIAAIADRLDEDRSREVAALIAKEAHAIHSAAHYVADPINP